MKVFALISASAGAAVASASVAGMSTAKPVTALEHPVIELDGANPILLPVSQESYSDPGAGCYDALRKEDIGEVLDVSGDIVRLDRPGTYTIRYGCKTKDGLEATPILRKIIVSPEVKPEYWSIAASADITLPKFKQVSSSMKETVIHSLSEDLDVPAENIVIDKMTEQQMWDKTAYVSAHFTVKTTQKALTEDLEYQIEDSSFAADFNDELKREGLGSQNVALGPEPVQVIAPGPPVAAELTVDDTVVVAGAFVGIASFAFVLYRKLSAASKTIAAYELASTEEIHGFANAEAGGSAAADDDGGAHQEAEYQGSGGGDDPV